MLIRGGRKEGDVGRRIGGRVLALREIRRGREETRRKPCGERQQLDISFIGGRKAEGKAGTPTLADGVLREGA